MKTAPERLNDSAWRHLSATEFHRQETSIANSLPQEIEMTSENPGVRKSSIWDSDLVNRNGKFDPGARDARYCLEHNKKFEPLGWQIRLSELEFVVRKVSLARRIRSQFGIGKCPVLKIT